MGRVVLHCILANMSICRCVNSGEVHVCVIIDMCIDVIKMIVFTVSDNTRHWCVDRWARQRITVL
jgi:hypothetical protein